MPNNEQVMNESQASYTYEQNVHMYKILADQLYSRKIEAVIREVCCNAHDAHVMVGDDKRPIFVQLPDHNNPYFVVQDWGPGMAHSMIMNQYTKFGWSAKRNEKEEKGEKKSTGELGLGAKSPYAYIDSMAKISEGFQVITVQDGVMRTYRGYNSPKDGSPLFEKVSEAAVSDPTWEHGTKVQFRVLPQHFSEFRASASRVLRWFGVTPNVTGLEAASLAPPEYSHQILNGQMSPRSYGSVFGVRMANVFYPVDLNQLGLTTLEQTLFNNSGYVDVPIGSVAFAPNREMLQYTEDTVAYLKEMLSGIVLDFVSKFKTEILNKEGGRWLWIKRLQEHWAHWAKLGLGPHLRVMLAQVHETGEVPQEEIDKVYVGISDRVFLMPTFVGNAASQEAGIKVWKYFKLMHRSTPARHPIVDGRAITNIRQNTSSPAGLAVNEKCAVVYVDCSYPADRLKTYFSSNDPTYKQVIVVNAGTKEEQIEQAKAYAMRIAQFEDYEGIEVINLSKIVPGYKPLPKGSGGGSWLEKQGQETVKFWTLQGQARHGKTLQEIVDVTDPDDLFYVIHDDRGYYKPYSNEKSSWEVQGYGADRFMQSILTLYQYFNEEAEPVVVMVKSEGAARRLKLEDNGFSPFFVKMEEFLKENLEKVVSFAKTHQSVTRSQKLKNSVNSYTLRHHGFIGFLMYHYVTDTSVFKRMTAHSSVPIDEIIATIRESVGTIEVADLSTMDESAKQQFQNKENLSTAIDEISSTLNIAQLKRSSSSITEICSSITVPEWVSKVNNALRIDGFMQSDSKSFKDIDIEMIVQVANLYYSDMMSRQVNEAQQSLNL